MEHTHVIRWQTWESVIWIISGGEIIYRKLRRSQSYNFVLINWLKTNKLRRHPIELIGACVRKCLSIIVIDNVGKKIISVLWTIWTIKTEWEGVIIWVDITFGRWNCWCESSLSESFTDNKEWICCANDKPRRIRIRSIKLNDLSITKYTRWRELVNRSSFGCYKIKSRNLTSIVNRVYKIKETVVIMMVWMN